MELTAKAVQGAALTLEGVHHVHGSHGLPLGVLRVGDGVPDHVLQKHLQHAAGLLVDEARDTLDASSASQTTDGRLGDALDVITKNFAVPLGSSLSEPLASFAAPSHDENVIEVVVECRSAHECGSPHGTPVLICDGCDRVCSRVHILPVFPPLFSIFGSYAHVHT